MNSNNILETIKMIEEEKLDIRTITMGISLLDCIDSDGDKAREKIYNKITTAAKDLVKIGNEIENEFGMHEYDSYDYAYIMVSYLIETMGKKRFLKFLHNAHEVTELSKNLLTKSIKYYEEYFAE